MLTLNDGFVSWFLKSVVAPRNAGEPGCTSMHPARLDPRRDPRRRDPPRQPEPENPPELLSEWIGVLLMANSKYTKIHQIAEVSCRPAPPVPLPERLQIKNEFTKLDAAEHQVWTGLPFFELQKTNFIYHPNSEWSKFMAFLHSSRKFATIVCDGWQLLIRPPLVGPPHGFSSLRVHYRRKAELPTTVSLTVPGDIDLVEAPALSFQHWASDPSSSGAGMEVDSLEALPKGPTDFTARLSRQSKVKRPRVEGAFNGFRSISTGAPSSSQEKDLQETVGMAGGKPNSIAKCVTDISYDISPTGFDHVIQPSSPGNDNKEGLQVVDKGESVGIQGAHDEQVPKPSSNGNGSLGNGAAFGAAPGSVWMRSYLAAAAAFKPPSSATDTAAAEQCLQVSGGSQGVPNGVEAEVPEMVISGGATTSGGALAKEDQRKNLITEATMLKPPFGGIDTDVVKKCSESSRSDQGVPTGVKEKVPEMVGSHEATSGAATCNDDWWKDALAKARSSGSDSGAIEKLSEVSGSAEVVKEKSLKRPLGKLKARSNGVNAGASRKEKSRGPQYKCSPSDMMVLQKSSQAKEKGVQSTASNVEVPLPPSYVNGDLPTQKGSQVADTGKAASKGVRGVASQKWVSKPSANGNGKLRIVQAIPIVPEAFRVNKKTFTKEQMSKPPSCANDAFQKPETELHGVKEKGSNPTLSSSSFENFVEQKSFKEAVTSNGDTIAPSSSSDRDSQQTCKSIAFAYGVTRSKPQKLKLKKCSTEGLSEDEVSTSACDAKKVKNGL